MRLRGIRLIVYLDDILILAQTESQLRKQVAEVAETLYNLGFVINAKKSVLDPNQSMEFLGFVVDSQRMILPEGKVGKVMKECRHIKNQKQTSPRLLAHLIGLLTSTNPVIASAPLHYRALQRTRNQALRHSKRDYDCRCSLPQ